MLARFAAGYDSKAHMDTQQRLACKKRRGVSGPPVAAHPRLQGGKA